MLDFLFLALSCAPNVAPETLSAIVHVESSYNPYAIGVVGGYLERQPKNLAEALSTVEQLDKEGFNWSAGIAQINKHNFKRYNLTNETVFHPCNNLYASARILEDCYLKAFNKTTKPELHAAFSCYYSGNYRRGFIPDKNSDISYVQKIINSANLEPKKVQYDYQDNLPPIANVTPIVPSVVEETTPIRIISTKVKKSINQNQASQTQTKAKLVRSMPSNSSSDNSSSDSETKNPILVF